MKQPRTESFTTEDGAQIPLLLENLSKTYSVLEETSRNRKTRLFDTFDWRLYRKNLICSISSSRFVIRDFAGNEIMQCRAPRKSRIFWSDIDDQKTSELLKKYLSMRALLPLISIEGVEHSFKIVNQDRKTVLRLQIEKYQALEGDTSMEMPVIISIQELRGYEKPFDQVQKILVRDLPQLGQYGSYIEQAFGIARREPLDYGAKFQVNLEKEATIGESVSVLCQALVESMAVNQPGVERDIDSEFLHDYRIGIRRTRSLLSLLRKKLPTRISYFEDEFKWLGSITGPLRDIDVYLLKEDSYKSLVPEMFEPGLQSFFDDLASGRQQVLRTLRTELNSERYERLLTDWQFFIEDHDSELFGCKAHCKSTIDKIILKRFNSFVKRGSGITEESPDDALHTLRIRGKKFRYLLEFFRSYYAPQDIDNFLKHMKKLQDNLGDFNDLSVQIEMLQAKLDGLHGRNKKTLSLAAALGSLITRLQTEHQKERARFNRIFEKFNTESNRQLILEMISND